MAGFTQGGYPDGTTQAMHDRYFGAETREECQRCEGTGKLCNMTGQRADGCEVDCGGHHVTCPDCNGSGYETPADTRCDNESDDPDPDIEF